MRRLSVDLGVSAMTVYGYVDNKDELLDAIAARVLGDLSRQGRELAWQDRLASVAEELRRLLREHPGVAEIVLNRPAPAMDTFRETMLAILDDAGFEQQDAIDLLILTSCYALGFAHSELVRADADESDEAGRLARLSPAEFPHLVAASVRYSQPLRDDTYRIGLRSLIRGFAEERLAPERLSPERLALEHQASEYQAGDRLVPDSSVPEGS
jgi:AcrR family transcriptional regulator